MLLVDSGGALVVAELKVVEDDGMLVQGIDYYDYVTANLQGLARACPPHGLEPSQDPRKPQLRHLVASQPSSHSHPSPRWPVLCSPFGAGTGGGLGWGECLKPILSPADD